MLQTFIAFCHKLILEKRINTGKCLTANAKQNTDERLDLCEMKPKEKEILACLE